MSILERTSWGTSDEGSRDRPGVATMKVVVLVDDIVSRIVLERVVEGLGHDCPAVDTGSTRP